MLLLATFALQQQNGILVTEAIWPSEAKIFTVWPFTESLPISHLVRRAGFFENLVCRKHRAAE